VRVILVHGMGRSPLSQLILGMRLRARGFAVSYFGYSATFSSFDATVARLLEKLRAIDEPYALAGHSLGAVLIRAALPHLEHLPVACFFLGPPSRVPKLATKFADHRLFRALTGDSGSRLADERFFAALPAPCVPTKIYAGTAGPRLHLDEPNDGVVTVSETRINDDCPVIEVPAVHTFLMNSRFVADDIVATLYAAGADAKDALG
jgi:hypothetical protein